MEPGKIRVTETHWNQMLADVNERVPEEACGLVAGKKNNSLAVYPVENIAHSPVRFLMDPQEQLRVFQVIDDRKWDLLAIYHSHPNGPDHPSPTDLREAAYPEAVHLIWSRNAGQWHCRGFLITKNSYQEIQVHITPNP